MRKTEQEGRVQKRQTHTAFIRQVECTAAKKGVDKLDRVWNS